MKKLCVIFLFWSFISCNILSITADADDKIDAHPIHEAITQKSLPALIEMIGQENGIHEPNELGESPLHRACDVELKEVVRLLLEKKVNIDEQDENGNTSMHVACRRGNIQIIKLLCDYQANISLENSEERTALDTARLYGHVEVSRHLEALKAPSNKVFYGNTLLHLCSREGNLEMAQELVANGANVVANDNWRHASPIQEAAKSGNPELVKLLLEEQNKNAFTEPTLDRALSEACFAGHPNVIKFLVEQKADINTRCSLGYTTLYSACFLNHRKAMKLLLDLGADPQHENSVKELPIHLASRCGQWKSVEDLIKRAPETLNVKDHWGKTPLHCTTQKDRDHRKSPGVEECILEVAEILCGQTGIEVNCVDNDGFMPLHYAAYHSFPKMVKLLLNNKADPNLPDAHGCTPLHYAAGSYAWQYPNLHWASTKRLLQGGANPNAKDLGGNTPLHKSFEGGILEITAILLDAGADLEETNILELKPFSQAWKKHRKNIKKALSDCLF